MAHLVGPANFDVEVAKQGLPDARDKVFVVQGLALAVGENILGHLIAGQALRFQCVVHHLAHLDVSLTAVSFKVFVFAQYKRFPHQNQTTLKIDIFPLQSVNFPASHASEESHGKVVAKVSATVCEDSFDIVDGEGLDVAAFESQWFDVGEP